MTTSMRRISALLAGTIIFSLHSGMAVAADVEQSYDWTGLYVGVHGGAGFGNVEYEGVGVVTIPIDLDASGFIWGGLVGYNFQSGSAVFGIEADISDANLKDTGSGDGGGFTLTATSKIDFIGTVRGRIGYAWDDVLAFATAGVAFADNDIFEALQADSDSNSHVGLVVGGGIEAAVLDGWTVRAEYLYSKFGEENYDIGPTPDTAEFDTHIIRVALTYKLPF